jgi:hypothetical protein
MPLGDIRDRSIRTRIPMTRTKWVGDDSSDTEFTAKITDVRGEIVELMTKSVEYFFFSITALNRCVRNFREDHKE